MSGCKLREYILRALFSCLFFLLLAPSLAAEKDSLRLHFIDVGEGASTLIETGDGRYVLVDAGNVATGAEVRAFLKDRDIDRLEALIITHPHPDHMGGVFHLLKDFKIGRILDNDQPIPPNPSCDVYRWYVEEIRNLPNYGTLKKGDRLQYGEVELEILWPPALTSKRWNANALVLRVRAEGRTALLMSDAGRKVEEKLMEEGVDLKSDILLVGHHGAADASSRAFLKAVSPELAIISINKDNVRGYPSKEVISRLKSMGTRVRTTYEHGTCVWEPMRGLRCERKGNVVKRKNGNKK